MKNVMRSEITYLFWLSYVVFLSSGQGLPRKFADCVFVLINKRSFEPFMCLDAVLDRYQSFLFQICFRIWTVCITISR